MQQNKKFAPAIFLVILICFLMPFISISCDNETIASLSGLDLITGTDISGGFSTEEVESNPYILVAALATVAGLVLGFMGKYLYAAFVAIAGTLSLIGFRTEMSRSAAEVYPVMIKMESGFWITLLLTVGAAALMGYYHFSQEKQPQTVGSPSTNTPMGHRPVEQMETRVNHHRFCTQCGERNEYENRFCTGCGSEMD
ncbi:hypothetical protein [Anoxynatronum sibiricum]|uniref:Zinc-ribbon domain-containing protein n=1 Tax=Anoxynatronum sibiricum TaxID=210623 RepID=A0ABU9VTZ4_9CLOT